MENQTESPVQEASNQTPPEPASQPIYRNKFFLGFVAISVLVAFLIGGFALGKNQTNKQSPTPTVTQTATPTPSLRQYSNEKVGYSFSYPKDFVLSSHSSSIYQEELSLTKKDSANINYVISITVESVQNPAGFYSSSDYNSQDFVVGGQKGKRYEAIGDVGPTVATDVENRKYRYKITYGTNAQKNQRNKYLSVYNQILSTFKFTNPTPQTATQTYLQIPEYGIKLALTDSIKDAYYLPETAPKGYVYLKVRSLDSEPYCAKDPGSTGALARLGKNDPVPYGATYSDFTTNTVSGKTIGDYFYYADLAQYPCAESLVGQALLKKVREGFIEAAKTITAM